MPQACECLREIRLCELLKFKSITLDKKELIESYTKSWETDCSDLSFANLFVWGSDGKFEFAEYDNVLYIKIDFKRVPVYFWAPIPKRGVECDYKKAVMLEIAYMREIGVIPTIRSVSEPFYTMIKNVCPNLYETPTDIAWDYVYEREKLATLSGKKLHGKRNHVNKFLSLYPNYEYRRITKDMVAECIALYNQWVDYKDVQSKIYAEERKSVLLALNHMDELGLIGGALFVEDKLIAFTLGERLNKDTWLIHIEKGDLNYEGVYPMINREYVLQELEGIEFVNREEDMGIEGMRKAKRAYYPIRMVEKYLFSLEDVSCKCLWGE